MDAYYDARTSGGARGGAGRGGAASTSPGHFLLGFAASASEGSAAWTQAAV